MKYVGFDIESYKILAEGQSMSANWPSGISCGCAAWYNDDGSIESKFYHNAPGEQMTASQAINMVGDLYRMTLEGFTIATVNGLGFDWKLIADEGGEDHPNFAQLVAESVDLCFMNLCIKGYFLGLDALAKGAGVQAKLKKVTLIDGTTLTEMSGLMAPVLWQNGNFQAVLEYQEGDSISTLAATTKIAQVGRVSWTSKAGRPESYTLPKGRILPVWECLEIPEPDTSWMNDPTERESVFEWLLPKVSPNEQIETVLKLVGRKPIVEIYDDGIPF